MEFNLYIVTKIRRIFSTSYNVLKDNKLLYIINKKSRFNHDLIVSNNKNHQILEVKKEATSTTMELHVIDTNNKTLAVLKNKVFSNNLYANTFAGPMDIIGNLMSTEFTIKEDKNEIAKISIHKNNRSKYLGMAVHADYDQLLFIGMLAALELKLKANGQSW